MASAIAGEGGLIGDVRTVSVARHVPDVLDRGVHESFAQAFRQAAIDSGVADLRRAPRHL